MSKTWQLPGWAMHPECTALATVLASPYWAGLAVPAPDRRHRLFYERLLTELGVDNGRPMRTIRDFAPLPGDIQDRARWGRVLSDRGRQAPWPAEVFDPPVERALALLPPEQRFMPERRLNGVLSMTADHLPLLGSIQAIGGLRIAEALWVTYAGGVAQALAALMTGATPSVDGFERLGPDRFTGRRASELTDHALRLYRAIYVTT